MNEYLKMLNKGNLIYPSELRSHLSIDIKKTYRILDYLKNHGFLVTIYEVYCEECCKSKGESLNSIKEFNEDTHCDNCDEHLNPLDNLIVLYKVIR